MDASQVLIYVLTGIIIVAGISVVVFKIMKNKKEGKEIEFEDLTAYSIQIVNAARNAINILSVNMDEFETKDDYMRCVLEMTIKYLKENAKQYEISLDILSMIDETQLSNAILSVINKNYNDCFSVLDVATVAENMSLFNTTFAKKHIDGEL